MASIAATSSSSTPAPERGQLWRHRRDGTYTVVTNIYAGRVITNGGETTTLGTPRFSEFYRENDYVGEFDGSRWDYSSVAPNSTLTVRLNEDNSVSATYSYGPRRRLQTDTFSFGYVEFFFEKVTFQSAPDPIGVGSDEESAGAGGPASGSGASSTPRPARGQLWISAFGDYCVILEVGKKRWHGEDVVGHINKIAGFYDRVPHFLSRHEYVGEFKDSRWTHDGKTVTVSLANDDKDVMMVDENGNEWPVPIQSFFAFATFVSAGPVLGSRRNVKKRKRATSSSSSPGTRMPDDLRNAISNGTAEEVKELLAKGYDVNAIYEDGPQTVLWLALFNRNVEMVKLLLACGADVNPKLRDVNLRRGATYLLLLLAVEDPAGTGELMEMFKLLLEAGANINATYERRTMLQLAKEKGKFDFLVEMLKYSEREKTTCAICMDPLGAAPALIVKLACGHMFHRTCISKWAGSNSTCPECRRRIDPSELQGQGEIFIFTGNDADGNVVYKLRQELKF